MKHLPALLTLALLAAACGPSPSAPTPGLPVVATTSVLGDLVQNVGGARVSLSVLVPAGADAHAFDPRPAEARALAQARLVFEFGLGFETWLDDLQSASGADTQRVVVTDGVEPLTAGEAHGEADPHVWHSVPNVERMVENIREALVQADPAGAETYRANAGAYLEQLRELEAWIQAEVARVPEARRRLVTTHDTFAYFAAHYGFTVVGTVLPTSTEGASPSAQQVAALVEAIRAQAVPAVFTENVSAAGLTEQVAREAGVQVVASLYTDALGPAGSEGDTYLKMMRANVTRIVTALGG